MIRFAVPVAARELGVSATTVHRWIKTGRLSADRRSRPFLISLDDLAAIKPSLAEKWDCRIDDAESERLKREHPEVFAEFERSVRKALADFGAASAAA